ncbi:MAG: hypothetical protein E7159_04565 [Firmicutes bacterium]|nr:hypothetical protein [Bacillota bacterium]
MQKQVIRLTSKEIDEIKKKNKVVGTGREAELYKVGPNVYKFYKDNDQVIKIDNAILDEDGVNVSCYKKLRNISKKDDNRILTYKDNDGVILAKEEAIMKAIEAGSKVKLSYLPNNIIYEGNKAIGCVYPYYKNTLGIYSSAYVHKRLKLMACKDLVSKVEELLDNNIYPLNLDKRNVSNPITRDDCDVLLEHGFNYGVHIVDLDGSSTLYTESYSHNKTSIVLSALSSMVLEVLTKIKLYEDNLSDDDFGLDNSNYSYYQEYVNKHIEEMVKCGVPENLALKYYEYGKLEMTDIKRLIRSIEK